MKPGIIRPMTAIPRLRVEDEEGYQRDAFGQFDIKGSSGGGTKVFWWLQIGFQDGNPPLSECSRFL